MRADDADGRACCAERHGPDQGGGASPVTTQSDDQQAKAKPRNTAGIWITIRESPLPVKAMLAGVFVNKLGAFIQVFLVLFLIHRGFTVVQAGLALSANGAGAVLGILIGGNLSDWLGARRATLISMFGGGVLMIGVLYAGSYPAVLVIVTLLGAVSLMYRPAAAKLLSELTTENRQVMIMALYRLALNAGTTAAPLIGAALVVVSWSLLFWADAITSLGYAIIAAFTLPRHSAAAKPASDSSGKRLLRNFVVVASDPRYGLYLFALFMNALVYMQYVSVLPLAMRSAGLATAWYAAMVAINGGIVIGCELLMTKVTQRWRPRIVVMTGFVLLGGGMAVYDVPLGVGIFLAGTLIWTLGEIIAGPTVFAYPAIIAPDGMRGRYLGTSQAIFTLGTAVGPVAGVALWDAFGKAVWLCCAGACVVGLLSARFGMRSIPPAAARGKS
jgi:MFS family permease